MRPNTSKLLIAVGVVATLSLGVVVLFQDGDSGLFPSSVQSGGSDDSSPKESDANPLRGAKGKLPGDRIVMAGSYKFDFSTKVVSGTQPLLTVSLDGTLEVAPVKDYGDIFRLKFEGNRKAWVGQNLEPGFEQELANPVFLEVLPDGRYQIKGERQLSELARKNWMMIGDFVFARPDKEPERESSALGRCKVSYLAPKANEVVREKVWCGSEVGVQVDAIKDLSSKQHFLIDNDRVVVDSTLTESLRTSGQNIPELGIETKVSAWRTSAEVRAVDAAALLSATVLKRDTDAIQREMDAQRIGGRTFQGVLAKYLKVKSKGKDYKPSQEEESELGRDFVGLVALLRTDAKASALAIQHVKNNGPLTDILLDALRDAGTPAAQHTLIEVATDSSREGMQRYVAARNMSGLNSPTDETVKFLLETKKDQDIGQHVTYSSGAVANNVRSSDPVVAEKLIDSLVAQLDEAPGKFEKEATLKALGNAGGPEVRPEVREALESDSSRIRAAAVNAVRRVESIEADAAIVKALSDENLVVRYEAAMALADRPPTLELVKALADAMVIETDFRVLSQELFLSGVWLGQGHDELRAPLMTLAESSSNEPVRKRAKKLLDRHPA